MLHCTRDMRRCESVVSRFALGPMDEETQHYIRVLKTKQARLNVLDIQAAALGKYNVPPQIEMERQSLMEELGMLELAIQAPARSEVGDELGPGGRFLVYYQQNREIKQSIAALAVESREGRAVQRNWIILVGLVVILILIAFVAFVTYLATKGAL